MRIAERLGLGPRQFEPHQVGPARARCPPHAPVRGWRRCTHKGLARGMPPATQAGQMVPGEAGPGGDGTGAAAQLQGGNSTPLAGKEPGLGAGGASGTAGTGQGGAAGAAAGPGPAPPPATARRSELVRELLRGLQKTSQPLSSALLAALRASQPRGVRAAGAPGAKRKKSVRFSVGPAPKGGCVAAGDGARGSTGQGACALAVHLGGCPLGGGPWCSARPGAVVAHWICCACYSRGHTA